MGDIQPLLFGEEAVNQPPINPISHQRFRPYSRCCRLFIAPSNRVRSTDLVQAVLSEVMYKEYPLVWIFHHGTTILYVGVTYKTHLERL